MSEKNIEIYGRVIQAFQTAKERDEPEVIFDGGLLAADCEWIPFAGFPGQAMYRGRQGFAEFWRIWTEDFDDWSLSVERLIDAGDDRVVGLFHQSATGKGSRVPVELHFGQVIDLKDGQIVRIRNIQDPSEALQAAGLSE
jgi:ketosteroid isomerase-like protein